MPIVFVHGVTVRDHNSEHIRIWQSVEPSLRKYVAPSISSDPERVAIVPAYWGDYGVKFAWGGSSCPPANVTQRGLEYVARVSGEDFWKDAFNRIINLPGHGLATGLNQSRSSLNQQLTLFLGDIFVYLKNRGDAKQPGAIPLTIMNILREVSHKWPDEPLIVVSHSMGGQIVYDLVTHFLPNCAKYADLRIDFWVAISSQIGIFEEMKLFVESNPIYQYGKPVPYPNRRHLGAWWNMWDPNDFLSFTVKGIISDVDDDYFESGLPVSDAHSHILEQPSFYAVLGEKVKLAKKNRWN